VARHALDPASQVFVIIGRQTFSSAVLNAIDFRSLGATLVGEPGGWKPSGYGSVTNLVLPNSGLQVSCSTRKFSDVLGDALLPDVPAVLSFADYISERDPALEARKVLRANSRLATKTMASAIRMDAVTLQTPESSPAWDIGLHRRRPGSARSNLNEVQKRRLTGQSSPIFRLQRGCGVG
jgi:hypothetical protein